jgi:hypothetical protein
MEGAEVREKARGKAEDKMEDQISATELLNQLHPTWQEKVEAFERALGYLDTSKWRPARRVLEEALPVVRGAWTRATLTKMLALVGLVSADIPEGVFAKEHAMMVQAQVKAQAKSDLDLSDSDGEEDGAGNTDPGVIKAATGMRDTAEHEKAEAARMQEASDRRYQKQMDDMGKKRKARKAEIERMQQEMESEMEAEENKANKDKRKMEKIVQEMEAEAEQKIRIAEKVLGSGEDRFSVSSWKPRDYGSMPRNVQHHLLRAFELHERSDSKQVRQCDVLSCLGGGDGVQQLTQLYERCSGHASRGVRLHTQAAWVLKYKPAFLESGWRPAGYDGIPQEAQDHLFCAFVQHILDAMAAAAGAAQAAAAAEAAKVLAAEAAVRAAEAPGHAVSAASALNWVMQASAEAVAVAHAAACDAATAAATAQAAADGPRNAAWAAFSASKAATAAQHASVAAARARAQADEVCLHVCATRARLASSTAGHAAIRAVRAARAASRTANQAKLEAEGYLTKNKKQQAAWKAVEESVAAPTTEMQRQVKASYPPGPYQRGTGPLATQKSWYAGIAKSHVKQAVAKLDTDGDGKVNAAELAAGTGMSILEAENQITHIDQDGDSKVDSAELSAALASTATAQGGEVQPAETQKKTKKPAEEAPVDRYGIPFRAAPAEEEGKEEEDSIPSGWTEL